MTWFFILLIFSGLESCYLPGKPMITSAVFTYKETLYQIILTVYNSALQGSSMGRAGNGGAVQIVCLNEANKAQAWG